ncbi:hypothetical protein SCOCK_610007 [Actinacidiphila cocklensis]|uniref:Uncharacterized protein n=1 Tax=Actinacidiphila cocklensis TaxID=887465 RepID=A0A9W4GUC4_9ACTN|nr:hypothetical protein SCOCK_610007 [Actinacidiphila cocklensis]
MCGSAPIAVPRGDSTLCLFLSPHLSACRRDKHVDTSASLPVDPQGRAVSRRGARRRRRRTHRPDCCSGRPCRHPDL